MQSIIVVRSVSYKLFLFNCDSCAEMALGMGTSEQMDLGSPGIKRYSSIYSKGQPEKVVEVSDSWKSKGPVRNNSIK